MREASAAMRTRCDALRESALRAKALSERTQERLSARREVVEQLRGVRGLIGKLSASLRSAPALEALANASAATATEGEDARTTIAEYVEAKEVLDALGAEGSDAIAFVRAKKRCDAAMEKIVAVLKARARASAIGGDEDDGASKSAFGMSDEVCLELLSALKVSQDELVDDFLMSRKKKLDDAIEASRKSFAELASTPVSERNLKDFMSALNQSFLGEFSNASEAFEKLFSNVNSARNALVKFTKDAFGEYFAFIREIYAPHVDKTDMIAASSSADLLNPKQLMCAMGTMAADLASVHRSVPEAALGDRAVETIERAVRSRVGAAFMCLERDLVRELDATYVAAKAVSAAAANRASGADAATSKSLLHRFIALSDTLLTSVQTLLSDVESLMDERPILISSWREEFAYAVRGHFASLIHALVSRLIVGSPIAPNPAPNPTPLRTPLAVAVDEARESSSKTPPPPRFLLVCARMCAFLHTSATKHIADALTKMFPASSAMGGSFSLDETRAMCESASHVLLMWYVEQSAQRISFMIRKSLTAVDWSKAREPREVRPLADYIADDLATIENECAQVLDVGEIDSGDGSTSFVADGAFTPVRSTQSSVMCAVIKRAVKSYVECVRCQTFHTKFAFQQVSLDVRYLAERVLFRFMPSGQFESDVYERRAIEILLKELRSACELRACDPTPMDKAVGDRILEKI